MSRSREFSAQRQISSHGLSQSRKKQQPSNGKISRVQKYQIATPKSYKNQSDSKKLSSSRRSHQSSSSQYICVGCFNHKLCSDKKLQKLDESRRQRQQEQLRAQIRKRQDPMQQMRASRLLKQANQMGQYNKNLIQQKRNQKQKQRHLQQLQNQQQRNQYESYIQQLQSKSKQKQRQRQQFKHQIQKQIKIKEQKKKHEQYLTHQQDARRTNQLFNYATQDSYFKEKQRKENQYRQELVRQIHDKHIRAKRQQQERKNYQNLGIGISEASFQRQAQRHKQLQKRKQQLLLEARNRQKVIEQKMQQEKAFQQKLSSTLAQDQELKRQQQEKMYQKRKKQTEKYMAQLKKQLQNQRARREQQQQMAHNPTNTSIQIVEKKVDRKQCRSCQKKFPKTYLTKVK